MTAPGHTAAPHTPPGAVPAALRGVTVDIATRGGRGATSVRVLNAVDLDLAPGMTALVGASGCGKSLVSAALTGLLPPGSRAAGEVWIEGQSLAPDDTRWRSLRGRTVGLVPQSAATSFTPVRTIGSQLDEVVEVLDGAQGVPELCRTVALPERALDRYPHEMSGGMMQRAAIAAALAGEPAVLVADEPTSALDAEHAGIIWSVLGDRAAAGGAVLVITHDVDAIHASGRWTSMALMRAGSILTQGPAAAVRASDDPYALEFFEVVR